MAYNHSILVLKKARIDSVRSLISKECPVIVEVDALQNLMLQMLELQVQIPESKMLLELLRQSESRNVDCDEILKGAISLKNMGMLLKKYEHLTISIPELKLLRQHHCDAVSWISRVKKLLVNFNEREDQENVVLELGCIMKEGGSLRIKGSLLF